MGEETSDTMNLDLNLGPGPEAGSGSVPSEAVNLDDWVNNIGRIDHIERIREVVRSRRWRWRQVQISRETQNLSVDLDQFMGNSGNGSTLQAGEGSVAAEERSNEVPKMCENNTGYLEDDISEKKSDVEKASGNDGSFFDCNICLDLATNPVVTCCGHLFCWSCLYRWLQMYSDAKECPVCKGEVTIKNVTPIYGRGSNTREPEEDSSVEIPLRPQARRIESLRQTIQRNPFTFPVEEMIRRLGSRFDLTRDFSTPQDSNNVRENAVNRIITFRGIRSEQNHTPPPEDIVDLTHSGTTSPESGLSRRGHLHNLHSVFLRRSQSHLPRSSANSQLSSAERLIEAYLRNHPAGRNQEQPPQAVEDRDSYSSIAAVINSESQMDTAVEIDSMVSLSTSSSRRRNDASRLSDVDSGDSRAPRRRRLN